MVAAITSIARGLYNLLRGRHLQGDSMVGHPRETILAYLGMVRSAHLADLRGGEGALFGIAGRRAPWPELRRTTVRAPFHHSERTAHRDCVVTTAEDTLRRVLKTFSGMLMFQRWKLRTSSQEMSFRR
jgi:hypothetical protein